jgi:hypothetical protein
MYIYIYIYVCVCVCVCLCIYIHIYIYIYIYIYICIYYTYIYVYVYSVHIKYVYALFMCVYVCMQHLRRPFLWVCMYLAIEVWWTNDLSLDKLHMRMYVHTHASIHCVCVCIYIQQKSNIIQNKIPFIPTKLVVAHHTATWEVNGNRYTAFWFKKPIGNTINVKKSLHSFLI